MEFINELLKQFSPDREVRGFAEQEGLLSDSQEDINRLKNISISEFLGRPENSEYASQLPLDQDFCRYLTLQLILKDKEQLDSLYMELIESNQLNLKKNTDLQSLSGLFWNIVMQKEKADKKGMAIQPFKLDYSKLLSFKEQNTAAINTAITEVNRFKEELAKVQDGLATYTHQIDKLLKEKASYQNTIGNLESVIVISEKEEAENLKIVERLKWLESKIQLQQGRIKSLKVYQENGEKKFLDHKGNSVTQAEIRKIKDDYRKLLVQFGEEEEKINKISATSLENKVHQKKYEERVKAIAENVNHLEKTRKGYQDYKVILGGRYEEALEKVFQYISRGEKAEKAITFYVENRSTFETSLRKLENSVESSFVFLQEVQLERMEIQRVFEACKMQEDLILYEYASLDELFQDIEQCRKDIESVIEKHREFNRKFDAVSKDFTDAKIKGSLLNPEKIGFFRSVLLAKLDEAKELAKKYLSYKKLHDTLLQNYQAITRSLQNNEKQYKEQFLKVSEGRDQRYNKTLELSRSCKEYRLRKDYLTLFLSASPLAQKDYSPDLETLEKNLINLSGENERASEAFRSLKDYQLISFRQIHVVNDLLDEFDERDIVRAENVEELIEELSTLLKLEKEFGGLSIGDQEEDSVSGEIIKSMNQRIAELADELRESRKNHEGDSARYQSELAGKEREITQLKGEVDKLANIVLEDHTREEKLLTALDEERKRNKELQDRVLSTEERFEAYQNSPFWKKNFVNTFSTIFFIGGLFYSIISDLPWERMQLSKAIPFVEALAPLHEREAFLFAEDGSTGLRQYLTPVNESQPSTDHNQHLIIDLHQYKVSVDANSFLTFAEEEFKSNDIEEKVSAEINRFSKDMNIDFDVFLEFYKEVYPNCLILTKENIEQATSTVYAMREKYVRSKRHKFKTIYDKYDYSNNVLQLFARLQLKTEDPYSSFVARLFNEYHASGYSPADAKEAILNNLASIQKQYRDFFIPTYTGTFTPDERIERMNIKEFVAFMTPYIKNRYYSFARQNKLPIKGDVDGYIQSLAEDIYYGSKLFNVPKTMAVLIAHQETFFHNMVGDKGKSEGPFQIYEPTKKRILLNMAKKNIEMPERLQSLLTHQTFSTFMATFHMSELMNQYSSISFKNGKGYIAFDLKKCTIAYNGSIKYYYEILKKKEYLDNYIENYASKANEEIKI